MLHKKSAVEMSSEDVRRVCATVKRLREGRLTRKEREREARLDKLGKQVMDMVLEHNGGVHPFFGATVFNPSINR